MQESQLSAPRRSSILRNRTTSTNKNNLQPTTIANSVKFREGGDAVGQVRDFDSQSPQMQRHVMTEVETSVKYSQLMLARDVNYINSLYHNVFTLLSAHDGRLEGKSHLNQRMVDNIFRVIDSNMRIKKEIDLQYKIVADLNEIANYLNITPEKLLSADTLDNFISEYQQMQTDLKWLQAKCNRLTKQSSPSRSRSESPRERRSREKKCRNLRNQIQKENNRIAKLQKEQKLLLKQLYQVQKQNLRKERTKSALKIQILEKECKKSYQKLKKLNKINHTNNQNKQNQTPKEAQGFKLQKMQSLQKIKSKKSFAKLFKK